MRKILTLFCVFLVLFSISACKNQKESPTEPKESSYEDALQLYAQIYNGDLQKIRYTATTKSAQNTAPRFRLPFRLQIPNIVMQKP